LLSIPFHLTVRYGSDNIILIAPAPEANGRTALSDRDLEDGIING